MNEQIYGFFQSIEAAEHAVAALRDHGVEAAEISVLHRADGSGAPVVEEVANHALTSTTAGDVVSGAAKGGAVGLALGVLGGAVALTIPGIGPILAAGPLWAAFSAAIAATAAGAVGGGAIGFLVDQGIPEHVAERYHDALVRGEILVSVLSLHIKDSDAIMLLNKYGATEVDSHLAEERNMPVGATETAIAEIAAPLPSVVSEPSGQWPPAPPVHVSEEPLEPVGGVRA